jgi:threonine-phosphate decarboxylase
MMEVNNVKKSFTEEHGGNIYKVSKLLYKELHEILDFSANINPLGIPQKLKEIMISNIQNMVYYPDPEYYKLRRQLSDYLGVPLENIIPGNGSSEIIYLLLKTLKPKDILIAVPSFSEYEKAAMDSGISIRYFRLKEEEDFNLDTKRLMDEISEGVDCVMLCNPNNPTSKLIPKKDIANIIEYANHHKTTVVIDEAFIELTDGGGSNSATEYVKKYENLFIIRAATKIFAVPGLRLGYGISNQSLVANMKSKQQPWSLNTLAACAGDFLAYADDYLKKTSEWLTDEKAWLYKKLKGAKCIKNIQCTKDTKCIEITKYIENTKCIENIVHTNDIYNLTAFEPDTNFILVKLPYTSPDSDTLKEKLAKKGVLIRDASNFKYLDNRFFRVAVKDRKSNERLINVLREEL